ncbi:MAG: hypothetical protein NTU43_01755 [Bacteroidetes bacterium]|nr:hypothetical protein [Bacteroidota bacterium]
MYSKIYFKVLLLSFILPISACAQTKHAEQTLFDVLKNKKEVFYFQDEFGGTKGTAYNLEDILNIKVPSSEFLIVNKKNALQYNNNQTEEGDQNYDENQPDLSLKNIEPLYQFERGRFIMHKNNGMEDYFIVEMNYNNMPLSIDFMTGSGNGNDNIIRFLFNEITGKLDEYFYQETKAISSGGLDPHISYEFVAEKLYVYDKSIRKVERSLNQADKDLILNKANILKSIVTNLWYLYKKCPTVNFEITLNKPSITKSIDSLMVFYKNTGVIDGNKMPVWNTFDKNKIQIVYSINKEGLNIYQKLKMYGLRKIRGEVRDDRVTSGIEGILRNNISCNNPTYRCLQRVASKDIGIIIENGKVISIYD